MQTGRTPGCLGECRKLSSYAIVPGCRSKLFNAPLSTFVLEPSGSHTQYASLQSCLQSTLRYTLFRNRSGCTTAPPACRPAANPLARREAEPVQMRHAHEKWWQLPGFQGSTAAAAAAVVVAVCCGLKFAIKQGPR